MGLKTLDYWYDGTIKSYMSQLVRAFSGFQWQPGYRNGVLPATRLVPCRMALTSKLVGSILRNNSTNTLLSVPMMTLSITNLKLRREDVQNPHFVDTVQVTERQIMDGKYTGEKGNSYSVARMMPVPIELLVNLDIWTSNMETKLMLVEQVTPIIFPSFDIQANDNCLDWGSLTTVHTEEINFSSRSIPVGQDEDLDICTISLRIPCWLSIPAMVTRQRGIQTIIQNVFATDSEPSPDVITNGQRIAQEITTPGDCHISVENEYITLLNAEAGFLNKNGDILQWDRLLQLYGTVRIGQSHIHVLTTNDPEGPFIAGTIIQLDPSASNKLIWQIDIDTLPANTIPPVNAVISADSAPGAGLPEPVNGARYLLLNAIEPSRFWRGLTTTAIANDIVEFQNGVWSIAFPSRTIKNQQYVLNLHTGSQLRWTGADQEWVMSIDGTYGPGFWRLVL